MPNDAYSQPSASVDSQLHIEDIRSSLVGRTHGCETRGYRCPPVYLLKKKLACKWICAIQNCVVQGSMLYS